MFQKCIYSTLTLLWFVAATAHASIIVPTGLNPGDTYHLAFVTKDARDAMDTDITVYNAFVQAQAALNPSLTGTDMGVTWTAIASTPSTAARANAFVEAPVFLLDGTTKIADDFSDLWDGTIDHPLSRDQFATLVPPRWVWTGSTVVGTSHGADSLGGEGGIFGVAGRSDWTWIRGAWWYAANRLPLYALSEKLTAPIPEPASFVVWLGLAGVLAVGTRLRRRLGRRV